MRFVVTGGERNDVTKAPALVPPGQGAQVLCDRGYDADWWRERLLAAGHQPVVPARRNRLIQPVYDEYTYRSRHLIENAFARLKSSRRIGHSLRTDHHRLCRLRRAGLRLPLAYVTLKMCPNPAAVPAHCQ